MEKITTYSKKNRFSKPEAVSYIKSFDNFEEGFSEIIIFNPELKNYCGDSPIYDAVIDSITKSIQKNIPSPTNPNYPNTFSFSINSNEVGFKTDINIAIGWRIAFSYKTGKTYYNFRITFISIPTYKNDTIKEMIKKGWSKLEKGAHQNRFWDSVEGKKHFKNNKNRYNNKKKEIKQEVETTNDSETTESDSTSYENNTVEEAKPEVDSDNSSAVNKEIEAEEKEAVDTTEEKNDNSTVVDNDEPQTREEAIKSFAILNPLESHRWVDPKTGKEELISKDEIQSFIKEQQKNNNSIIKAAVEGSYVITHRGINCVINVNRDPSLYSNVAIDLDNHIISFSDGTSFNYDTLTVLSD